MKKATKVWLAGLLALGALWGSTALAQQAHGEPKAVPQATASAIVQLTNSPCRWGFMVNPPAVPQAGAQAPEAAANKHEPGQTPGKQGGSRPSC